MRVIRTIAELREHLGRLRAGSGDESIGFVPTMGALHAGHLSLVEACREQHPVTVLSIFVNPKQFDDRGDFSAYPRVEDRDLDLARAAGVDVVFAPDAHEMYPERFGTTVSVDAGLTGVLEGAVRGRAHFDGVTTVVCKLLLAVQADAAYFGEKDFQQLLVVRRMVADLGIATRIEGCPTVREPDGLAMSSRNARLTTDERRRAAAVPRVLSSISAAVGRGITDVDALRDTALAVLEPAGLRWEYLAFVHPATLEPVASVIQPTVCAIAVPVGTVRLIDNLFLTPGATAERRPRVGSVG